MGKLWEVMRRPWRSYGKLWGSCEEVTPGYETTVGTPWESMAKLWEVMRKQ